MKKVALLGYRGFLGRALNNVLETEAKIHLVKIDRKKFNSGNFDKNVDFAINCAMPSARFWAENNPKLDFIETVKKTHDIIDSFPNSKIIQISSISARTQQHKVYGRNKRAAEMLLDKNKHLIFRLGPLYGENLSKGVIIDLIKNQTVYVSGKSKYGFTDINWVSKMIINNINLFGIVELGAKGYVSLLNLKNKLSSNSEFCGEIDNQIFTKMYCDKNSLSHASEVIDFAKKIKFKSKSE